MYYIYHIPGIKIGCSKNPEKRVAKQGFESYEILEHHTDSKIAGIREKELQKQYGYKQDAASYDKVLVMASQGGKISNSQSKAGRAAVRNGAHIIAAKAAAKSPNAAYKQLVTCEHCGKQINKPNYGRHHGSKCKSLR